MKTLITLGFGIVLLNTAFASDTIEHANCKLHGSFKNQDLNMILEKKGYTLYEAKKPKADTLVLDAGSYFEDSILPPITCVENEPMVKFTFFAAIYRFDGKKLFKDAHASSSFNACLQTGGEKSSQRAIRKVLSALPECKTH